MSKEYDLAINEQNAKSIMDEIEEAYFDIPFGNTGFQTEAFVIAAQITPARAYRSIGLQMHSILSSLRSKQYDKEKFQIQIDELKHIIESPDTDEFTRRKKEIELKEAMISSRWADKLMQDSIKELNIYYSYFKQFPKYTREQFEREERLYFEQSLQRQALGLTGAKEALLNMMDDMKTIKNFNEQYAALPEDKKDEMLHAISRSSLAGYIRLKDPEENGNES